MASGGAVGRPVFQVPGALPGAEAFWRWLARWRYRAADRRDRRLDLLRGYCVFAMVVDHLDAPTWLYSLTGGNRFFVSAAEGFLFISGLVMGMVYRPLIERLGLGVATAKAIRRAILLYCVTVGATLGFMWLSSRLGLPWGVGLDMREVARDAVMLARTYYLTDVLVLYTVLVALAPLAFLLLRRNLAWLLLGASWGVWLGHQIRPIDMPWPSEEGAFFYLAAWQVLFVSGLAIGWHRDRVAAWGQRFMGWPGLLLGLAALAFLAMFWRLGPDWAGRFAPDGAAAIAAAFAKWNLPPARLLACAGVFLCFFLLAHHLWGPLRAALGWLLLPFGESALTAYVVHLGVVAAMSALRESAPRLQITSSARGTLFQLAAVALVWALLRLWIDGRRALERRLSGEVVARRLDPAFGALFAVALASAIALAPLPASPVAGLVPVRSDRASIDEPSYLLHLPPQAALQQPLPVVVVLHTIDEDAEVFGQELVALADREGWLLVAPRLDYHPDALDPEATANEAPRLLRGLRAAIGDLPNHTGLLLRRRATLFGYGRGAVLAERYALAYPDDVHAAALLAGGGYTLPPRGVPDLDPPFPFGARGFGERLGQPIDPAGTRRVHWWIGVGEHDTELNDTSRAWDPYLGTTRVDRARTLARVLGEIGAPVELEVFPGAGHAVTPEMRQAVAAFGERVRGPESILPPRPRRQFR